jgi:hypothetical protein
MPPISRILFYGMILVVIRWHLSIQFFFLKIIFVTIIKPLYVSTNDILRQQNVFLQLKHLIVELAFLMFKSE